MPQEQMLMPWGGKGTKKMEACQYCGGMFTARGIQMHERWCEENPQIKKHGAPCNDPGNCCDDGDD